MTKRDVKCIKCVSIKMLCSDVQIQLNFLGKQRRLCLLFVGILRPQNLCLTLLCSFRNKLYMCLKAPCCQALYPEIYDLHKINFSLEVVVLVTSV